MKVFFKRLISIFWNKRLHIIIISMIAIIIGLIYSFNFITPKYQAYTTLDIVKTTSKDESGTKTITSTDVGWAKSLISTYSQIAKSKTVLRKTINNLQINETEETLTKKISVEQLEDSVLLKITVEDEDPVKAMKIANEVTKVFSAKITEIYGDNGYILDEAEESITPCNIKHVRNVLIFFLIGFGISIIYVLIASLFDNTIKNAEDIENNTDLTSLVLIPFVKDETKRGGKC